MGRLTYLNLDYFDKYFKSLKKRELDFKLTKTTYSRKIELNDMVILFNEDGGSDYNVLSLINKVRKNARTYLGSTSFEKRQEYIHFYDLFRKPKSNEVIWKVDVRSAYWEAAMKRGIVDSVTNDSLIQAFEGKPAKEMKRARLKSLGALATTKNVREYVKGKMHKEDVIKEPTRELYMDICRDVDILMRDCIAQNQDVVYYYWDCIFVPINTANEVIEYFKELKYDVTVEETKLEYQVIAERGFIISQCDSKAYMVRKESIDLLD